MKHNSKKSVLVGLMSLSLIALLSGCADKEMTIDESENIPPTTNNEQISETFTLSQLAEYNGSKGNKSYVGFNGKVYDVTDLSEFSENGPLYGKVGLDLSNELKDSPEYEVMFNNAPMVGTLVP